MKAKRFLTIALIGIGSIGCQPVLVQYPLGVPVSEDLSKRLDGVWQSDDNKYVFFVKTKPNGLLDVAGIEWRDGRFIVRDTSCIITRLGDWTYLNVPLAPDSAGRRFFLFAPFVGDADGNIITAFIPSYDFFKGSIDKKELIGTSKGKELKQIEIENSKQRFFEEQTGAILRSSQPVVLKRTRKGPINAAWPVGK